MATQQPAIAASAHVSGDFRITVVNVPPARGAVEGKNSPVIGTEFAANEYRI
jgi:hypothetical protein